MKYFSAFLSVIENIINNFDLAAVIAAVISISASIYIFRTTPKYDLVYKRYTSLIFPLFELMEPHLFKTIDKSILSDAINLIEKNKAIAGSKLLYTLYFCKKNPCQEHFDLLCSCVSKEYDQCCSRLGLGKRSISYKIYRQQYKSKAVFILYIVWNTFIFMVVLVAFVFILFYLSRLLKNITGIEILPLARRIK